MSATTKSSNKFFTPPLGGFSIPQAMEHTARLDAARRGREAALRRRELADVPSSGGSMQNSDPAMTAAFL